MRRSTSTDAGTRMLVDAADAAPPRPGDPGAGYQGTIGRTLRESTPWWPPQVEAPPARRTSS